MGRFWLLLLGIPLSLVQAQYPQLATASLSSSSPVLAELSYYQYDQVIASSLGNQCANAVRNATTQIEILLKASSQTNAEIKLQFGCGMIDDDVAFLYVLADTIAFAVQYNSSYGLVPAVCYNFTTAASVVTAYSQYVSYIFGRVGNTCPDWDISSFTNQSVGTAGDNMRQWMWQSCREFGYFQTAPSNNSLRSELITAQWHLDVCQKLFGISIAPTISWTNDYYGGQNISTSNTVFTNGNQDPWTVLSVTSPLSNSVPSLIIDGAAHCANWAAPTEFSPQPVQTAQQLIGSYLGGFTAGCAGGCNGNGLCEFRQTSDVNVAAQCVCYHGYEGDACDESGSFGDGKVPWWSLLIVGISAAVIAGIIAWKIGERSAISRQYDNIGR